LGLQEIIATERLNKWGDLDKKHCQPRQHLKRKIKCIKVVDGISPEDNDSDEYQTDSTSESEANNALDDNISNGEVSLRSSITSAFTLISSGFSLPMHSPQR
jgi:hypothetical protein